MSLSAADKKEAGHLLGILSGRKHTLLPADFMSLVIDRVGGPGKLADIVAKILTDPAVPAVAKQRTLSDLARMMQHVEMKSAPEADLTQHSTDDLKAILRETLGQLDGEAAWATTEGQG